MATHRPLVWVNSRTKQLPAGDTIAHTLISGFGTSATYDIGTVGAKVPLLNGTNTWWGDNSFGNISFLAAQFAHLLWAASTPPGVLTDGHMWRDLGGTALHYRTGGATQSMWHTGNLIKGVASGTDVPTRADADARYDALGSAAAALAAADAQIDAVEALLAVAGVGEAAGVVVTDLNIPLTTKFMVFSFGLSTTNAPATSVGTGVHMQRAADEASQVVVAGAGRIFFRVATASTYGAWQELTKRNPGINSAATGAITPNWRNNDVYARTALNAPTAINAPSAGNEGADGQLVGFAFYDDGTSRALTWDAVYTGSNKPAATTVGQTSWVWFRRNAALATYEFQFTSNAVGSGGAVASVNGYTGAVVLAAVDVGCWTTVAKAASTARTATAVLAADPDLTIALAIGKYAIRGMVHFNIANATMDFKYGIVFGGTATSYMTREFITPGGAGTAGASQAAYSPITASEAITTTNTGYGSLAFEIIMDVTVAGTFAFHWAQNTSDAAAATVLFGSRLEYKKVA